MSEFDVADPEFQQRVRDSFAQQGAMAYIGATLTRVEPGLVEIELPYRAELSQQHGYLHAGILSAIADTACGYAAATLMPRDADVLSVEFKINLLRPAAGKWFFARASVIRAGRTLTVTRADVFAEADGSERLVATMQATMIAVSR